MSRHDQQISGDAEQRTDQLVESEQYEEP